MPSVPFVPPTPVSDLAGHQTACAGRAQRAQSRLAGRARDWPLGLASPHGRRGAHGAVGAVS